MAYQLLKSSLDKSRFIREFDEKASKNGVLFYQLNLTTKALLIARMFETQNRQESAKKDLLYITKDDNTIEEYYEDLCLLLGKEAVAYLPDYEILPYEDRSPHHSIRAQRLQCLKRVIAPEPVVLLVSAKNFVRHIISPEALKKSLIRVGVDYEYDIDNLCSRLVGLGYEAESMVIRTGQISRRGGILDIYSPGSKYPLRLDFFGDIISSCRYFDPSTQRSVGEVDGVVDIVPAREVFLDDISSSNPQIWEKIHTSGLYEGIEQDISLLYENKSTIIEYFDIEHTSTICDEFVYLKNSYENLMEETRTLYEKKLKLKPNLKVEVVEKTPLPEMLFADFDKLLEQARKGKLHYFSSFFQESEAIRDSLMSAFTSQTAINSDIKILERELSQKLEKGWRIVVQFDNQSQINRMQELLPQFKDKVEFEIGVLHRGFNLDDAKLALFTDHEIFNRYKQKRFQEYFPEGEALVDYETLNPGDYIVHIEHGIGLYEGLILMKVNKNNIECLSIRYADNARVYVPTYQLRLVTRYVSEDGITPEIHKIGSKKWETIKNKAKKQIEYIADDLVNLYAERSARKGVSLVSDSVWQDEMEESFIYEDTPDQKRATEEIKADMEQSTPMERLLCGDVGFGKTEVAVRAAFKAIVSGWQVAVLVPTTLLAEQHYWVFKERLAQYPVNITMLSRFRTPSQIKKDLVLLREGKIDIAIGTHRLLSTDVSFKKLGLLIIDEEHRFGVRHKDKLRRLKTNVDTLYMSATPIPRTLNMALAKLKEMSLIQTSPKARLPIRTIIIPFEPEMIKDAILREVDRGGQVLFIHNRVETIESIASELRLLLPKVRIVVGHGQLPERMLEKIMLDFYNKEYDVMVATTIIESGLDIANANTIIVNRADMFGLAQLYQIRGRVGRSNRRAYAYFIIPQHFKEAARRRLEALTEYNTLGSGYQIAMRDLELRGAGTLLGTKQSGVINSVGFNYYNKLLAEAIENMSAGKDKESLWNDEKAEYREKLQVDADFFFPQEYIKDEKTRLDFYNRMLGFKDVKEFGELEKELKDRFGDIPNPARRGIRYYKLRLMADKAKLESFRLNKSGIRIEFNAKTLPSKTNLQQLVTNIKDRITFKFVGNRMLMSIELNPASKGESGFQVAETVLKVIAGFEAERRH